MRLKRAIGFCVLSVTSSIWASVAHAAPSLVLPLMRTAYQTNETIPVTVLRDGAQDASDGKLVATLKGDNGSSFSFTFTTAPVGAAGGKATGTQFLNLAGQLLRPGSYTLDVAVDGGTASTKFEVYSDVRYTTYQLINWGNSKAGAEMRTMGESGLGYTLNYGGRPPTYDPDGDLIRAGVDFMPVCTMSGGHQMDLRMDCDWSDPYVIKGGTRRASREAFAGRVYSNFLGVHFYDEPGLTWTKDPKTGEGTPHGVPQQLESFKSAFGKDAPDYHTVNPDDANSAGSWNHWAWWKLSFMDAAWADAKFGVDQVNENFVSATQSQYGWTAFTDGYYFNVARSLDVTSGHGGYHDFGLGYHNPGWFLELSRGRDTSKDNWYLPTWYGNTTPDELRVEQYLSFQVGIQGMMTAPDYEPSTRPQLREAVTETNKMMARLGTIFTTGMKPKTPEVGLLYSMSANIYYQTRDRSLNYAGNNKQNVSSFTYIAGKMIQQPMQTVVDEDIVDGTLAANYKAIVIGGCDYLDPQVVKGLEDFIAGGGKVLNYAGAVEIKGATNLNVTAALPDEASDAYKAIVAEKKWEKLEGYQTISKYMEGAKALADAMRAELDKAGIKPVIVTDAKGLCATKHTFGEVDYYFAVNATPDASTGKRNSLSPVTANVSIDAGDRPIYDAIKGGEVGELKGAAKASLSFIPGEMKVYAATARPIGGVKVGTPVVSTDLTNTHCPISLCLSATVLDNANGVLAGVVPLQITVTDPSGKPRYSLYRATRLGVLELSLPLAANDPAGNWTVSVTELLNNSKGEATFAYAPAARNNAVAGLTHRALMFTGEEKNLFRFARNHQAVTIVPGTGAGEEAAAKRLVATLDPWGIKATIMSVADAGKSRALTEKEASTFVGLEFAGTGQIKPGTENGPLMSGYAVTGPVILVGTPETNEIIKQLQTSRFLPYNAAANALPGAGRGYVAWQRDAIGNMQESVTLIGYDEAGLSEAVGTFYEAIAGLEPLTRWTMPIDGSVSAGK